ncbi:Hypothetical protein LUCI_1210 [Lucifera butyrica]|uniref:DUF3870 domain-containing protein n=1 Tax=Lucifera butyrica TaxID=1351585 RepID=A0A498R4C2_9FIRM|nr:DUF3870 domain-containing protein [Lucifera butyrica]VBB05999.1 Hypothetical protein LUCI_1210 [Lucifera butyrica]
MDKAGSNLVLFSGYAKLPTGITASEMYKVIGLVVLIDVDSGEIVEADCTLATRVARDHVSTALVGNSIKNGPDYLIHLIDRIYQGSAKKAVITAIRIIYDKYRSYKEGWTPSILD